MYFPETGCSHLVAIHKYNLKMISAIMQTPNVHPLLWAKGWIIALLLAKGVLSLPFVYSDEVWTGIEHQVASHLMLMGRWTKGWKFCNVVTDMMGRSESL